jgi:hypothetical protein
VELEKVQALQHMPSVLSGTTALSSLELLFKDHDQLENTELQKELELKQQPAAIALLESIVLEAQLYL